MSLSCCGDKSLNPYDGKWQKTEENAPDKEQEWTVEWDEWTLSNDAIKAEIQDLHSAISAVLEREELTAWQAEVLRITWSIHTAHFRSNLEAKKEVVTPFLEQRINMEADAQKSRDKMIQALDKLDEKMSSLTPETQLGELKDLLHALEKYLSEVSNFTGQEEATERLLMRAFFTPEDVKPLVEQLMATYPSTAVGSMIYYATNSADNVFNDFMNQQGISLFTYYWDLRSKRNDFESSFANPLDAVTFGAQITSCAFC